MEELINKKRAEIDQKNTPSSKDKTASVTGTLYAKSTTSEEKYNEKEKFNNARKKLQALSSSSFSSKKPKASKLNSLFNEKEEISNYVQMGILTILVSSDEEDNITNGTPKPVSKTNSEEEPKKLVQKVLTSIEVDSSTGSNKEKYPENHNLQISASSAMGDKDIEPKSTPDIKTSRETEKIPFLELNYDSDIKTSRETEKIPFLELNYDSDIKTSRETEKIPFLELNYEIEILEALKEQIRETNTVTSEVFVPPLFQPKSWKVKDMREIIKPGMLENKENPLATPSFDLKSHENVYQTLKNCLELMEKLVASKPDENESNDKCLQQNDFAPISPVEPSSWNGANKELSLQYDGCNNSCLTPNKDFVKNNQTTKDVSVLFKDQSKLYNLGYQVNPQHYQQSTPCSPKYSTVQMNPNTREYYTVMPAAHPYTESDYRSASSHSFSRVNSSMQTIDSPIPQFSPSEYVPVSPVEISLKPNNPNTNAILFERSSVYKVDVNYRGNETRPYHTNYQNRKKYLREIPPSRENKMRREMQRYYDNHPYYENRRRSNYNPDFENYLKQYNTSETRRNYYQRARSVGPTGFDEERTKWRGSFRDGRSNHELIDCQSMTIACVNGQGRLQHPFEDRRRRQRSASMDKSFVRYSNSSHIESKTLPPSPSLPPECRNIKSVRAENFDKERESESESFSDHYEQSNKQINRTENMKNKIKYQSLSKKLQPEKILTKPIETNEQNNVDQKYKTAKNITVKSNNIDKKYEKHKLMRSSETIPKKKNKGVKTKYSLKMKTVRSKFKSSMFKKSTKLTKKDTGVVFVKRKEITTTTRNKFSSSGSSNNKENSSRPNKVKQSEKANNYKQSHANRTHFSISNTKSSEKDTVGKAKKAKKAFLYTDSESESSQATRGHCSKLNDKPYKKSSFSKIKRHNRQIIYSDSDSETKKLSETKKSDNFSRNWCKDILLNGGSDVIADSKKANVTKKTCRNVKPYTTADYADGTKMNEFGQVVADAEAKKVESASNNSHDLLIKNPLDEEITLNDNTRTKNVKQNNICNDLQDVCDSELLTQEKHRDNVPDLKEQIITKQRIDNSEHKQSESSHINKTAIPNDKHVSSIDNGVSSTTEQCVSHSDASSIRHKDEKLRKVVDFHDQENNAPEMSINACLTLAKDLLNDVPKTIFELFIHDLCLIRAKEEISEIIDKLKSILTNVEVAPSNDSNCNLRKSSTSSFKRTKKLKIKIVKLSKNEFKVKRKHGRRRKHKHLTEAAVDAKSNDQVVENRKLTTPVILLESQETDILDKSCHTKITNIQEHKAIDQNQITSDKIDCSHFKVVNVNASVKKYICFINGITDNFTTSSPLKLLRHIELKHAEEPVWNGYCAVCKKIVISQGQHNYVECLRHMLDNHNIDQFPVFHETESTSKEDNSNMLLDTQLKTHESENSNVNHGKNSAMRETYISSNEFSHFKIIWDDSESETYVCCIGGINNHFKTTQKISMIRHARKMHPEVWDGYCCVCKELVMHQEQLNFGHCFKHMVESHLDNFPVLDQAETNKEMSHPEKANLEPQGLNKPKVYHIIENILNIAKGNSFDTTNDNAGILSPKQLDKQNFLNPNLEQLTSGEETHCSTFEDFVTIGKLESLDEGDNTIGKEKNISNSHVGASHSQKVKCQPERPPKCEELQAKVMKAKHSSVLNSMLSEEKLVQIYKCTGPFCAYTTNLPDKALLHVMTHQKASEKDLNVSFCAYCDFACKDPTDGVAHVFVTHGHCNYACGQCFYRASASQLVLAHMHRVHGSSNNILQVATPACDKMEEPLPQEIEINSYICGNKNKCTPGCQHPYFTQGSFTHHLRSHDPPYLCFICAHSSNEPTELLLHLSEHGLKQYHCTWCSDGADCEEGFLAHFSACHPTKKPQAYTRNVSNVDEGKIQTMVLPLLEIDKPIVATKLVAPNKRDPDIENDYAVREVYKALNLEELVTGVSQKHQFLFGDSQVVSGTLTSSQIFNQSLSYKLATANDANLMEKLTQGTVSDNIGSRNTVKRKLSEQESLENKAKQVRYDRQTPSLDVQYVKEQENSTEETHRDKEESQYPKYVPNKELYWCGAESCLYKSLVEVTLKWHWETLHLNNSANYKCPHCQYFVTDTQITWAQIIEHLNMHGNRLYVCSFCDIYHFQYKVLEEHVSKFHEGAAQVRTLRDLISSPVGDVTISTSTTVPWRCTRCKYRTNRKKLIAKHCKINHTSHLQFRCTECEFESGSKLIVKKHKYKTHGFKNDNVIKNYYFDDGPEHNKTVDDQKKEKEQMN